MKTASVESMKCDKGNYDLLYPLIKRFLNTENRLPSEVVTFKLGGIGQRRFKAFSNISSFTNTMSVDIVALCISYPSKAKTVIRKLPTALPAQSGL